MPNFLKKLADRFLSARAVQTIFLTSDEISEGELQIFSLIFDRVLVRQSKPGLPAPLFQEITINNVVPCLEIQNGAPIEFDNSDTVRSCDIANHAFSKIIEIRDKARNCKRILLVGAVDRGDCNHSISSLKDLLLRSNSEPCVGRVVDDISNFHRAFDAADLLLVPDSTAIRKSIADAARERIVATLFNPMSGLE